MPVACMCAYMMVEPTNLKPRRCRSLLKASDSGTGRRHLGHLAPAVDPRPAADEFPAVAREAAELALHRQEQPGIDDRRLHLEPVADDAVELQQPLDLARVEARHAGRVEAGERLAVALALAQDRRPAETGLRALEDQELEQAPVVVHRYAPFTVVVGDVLGTHARVRPAAARAVVGRKRGRIGLRRPRPRLGGPGRRRTRPGGGLPCGTSGSAAHAGILPSRCGFCVLFAACRARV